MGPVDHGNDRWKRHAVIGVKAFDPRGAEVLLVPLHLFLVDLNLWEYWRLMVDNEHNHARTKSHAWEGTVW